MSGKGSSVCHMPPMTMAATWLVMPLLVTRYRTAGLKSASLAGMRPSMPW